MMTDPTATTGEPESSVTERVAEEVLPLPTSRRRGTALCLSGGGYRAALFHLGALRRLNELGILTRIDTFTSVSGGSITAALLARQAAGWPQPGKAVPDWDRAVAEPLRTLVRRNIRTRSLAKRLLPWNWTDSSTAVRALADAYERHLIPERFGELPTHPRFVFCATDMTFGVNWVFDSAQFEDGRGRLGDYQAGYVRPVPADWPAARAVAASSCAPPLFGPLPVGLPATDFRHRGTYEKPDRADLLSRIRLSDGGVYDNMGLEPVWKDHETILVSDGGAVFEGEHDRGIFWRLMRYASIADRQSRSLRRRWLIAGYVRKEFKGAYWGIGGVTSHYPARTEGYPEDLVDAVISEVRTDLDSFSEDEMNALENHGYMMAEAAIQSHCTGLVCIRAPLTIPHPAWLDRDRLQAGLADSSKRRLLGRR
ncbi:MAG: hypothetical protein QOJ59_4683 [Thermomicrobiales bacterium]|nr:hypothetical protein [Thermomicrobiales bacterium]